MTTKPIQWGQPPLRPGYRWPNATERGEQIVNSYASSMIRETISAGPNDGEDFFRVKVSGLASTNWFNVKPDQLEAFAKIMEISERLEYLRGQLRAECISMSELFELQGLADHIELGDVELLEPAGVPEYVTTMDTADLDPGDPDEASELTRRARQQESKG